MKSKIVLQVHDEIMIETALEEVYEVKDILKEKNIEEIPIEKKELQLKVSHLLQKEFK